jgi:hypothetical protein
MVRINSDIDWSGATAQQSVETTVQTTASGTYVPLAVTCGHTFVAPPSGIVMIHYQDTAHASAAAAFALSCPQVRQGNTVGVGTIVYAANDNDALQVTDVLDMHFGATLIVTGLTGGTTYNVEFLHRSNGTGTFSRRKIVSDPTF